MQRVAKPKSQKGKRFLASREPKIFENTKQTIFVKGGNTSQNVSQVLKEMYQLKRTSSIMYKRKNILRPFEDETPLEFFSKKADASLFMFGSHSKKRPNNIIIGRMFDFHVLDMIELGVESFTSMSDVEGPKCAMGIKPCIMFTGDQFESEPEYIRLKSVFLDFFRGQQVTQVRLAGIEHVIMISAIDGKIYLRNYRIQMKKSGSKMPRIELQNMGPSADFMMRRTKLASDDLYKRSLKVPKTAKIKKRKNISRDAFGSQLGRIHMQKQNLDNLQTRKLKALKRKTTDTEEGSSKKTKQTDDTDT